jgi:hypothetical protein
MLNNFKLSNPYIFWPLIILSIIILMLNNIEPTNNITNTKINNDIVEQSYKTENNNTFILDLSKIEDAHTLDDFNHQQYKDNSLKSKAINIINSSNIWLVIYTIFISILFIVREKQNRKKIIQNEKLEDRLRIISAKKDNNIDPDLFNGLKEYSNYISNEIDLNKLEDKIINESNLLIFSARLILERLFLELYSENNSEEATLNTMIYKLNKSKTITTSMLNYAHIIKAFGNKAAHPNIKDPIIFTKQDVKLVLSNLLQLLKEIDKHNLMDIKNV